MCTSHVINKAGYVEISVHNKTVRLHRFMYEMKYGKITSEVLRHTCDNSWCINPDHLIQGSHADNVQDRVDRNRSARGQNNGRSKLIEEQVLEIFHNKELTNSELANLYNVDSKVIRDIKNKKRWKYLIDSL